jgi:dTDP-4-dehydrorhamnose reductase
MSTVNPYLETSCPEIWGGMECTINRVGQTFRDQLSMSGHYDRPGDIELFSSLGVRKLRFPILWEKHEQTPGGEIDWTWTSDRLSQLKAYNIEPIAGLVHHGSGPSFTNLYDPNFPQLLARYASKVAARFPSIQYYTPVNEPLTTARFSGLYGFWFPHHKNEFSFVKMLLNQLKGTILAMQEVRKLNPAAMLVQTEDLAKTHSTAALKYQAEFENIRRWLTNDLLSGRVNRSHFFWDYFLKLGIEEKELAFFLEHSCPPDIAGFNYYVTSERFLDDKIERYPEWTHGGNVNQRYADTEAVRVNHAQGLETLLREAWNRYGLPMAITECHLSCTREEQMRWFYQAWQTCCRLREEKIDIRGLTAWSLLGAYDWNSLLTRENGHYEAGAFDLRGDRPRKTALGKLISSLGNNGSFGHPLLQQKGWWNQAEDKPVSACRSKRKKPSPLLIVGKNGTLATAFMKVCTQRSIPYVALSRTDLNILKPEEIRMVIDRHRPWAMINATGYVRVDDAEVNKDECFSINAVAPANMAAVARETGLPFMTFSSDLVFDGEKKDPYHEGDRVKPINVYGRSKAEGEKRIEAVNPGTLIIRSSAFFGPWDQYNFIFHVWKSLREERPFPVVSDVVISPTYVPDLVNCALDLFIDEEKGVWHLSNEGELTWLELANRVAERKNLAKDKLVVKTLEEMNWPAMRPRYSALVSEKGAKLAPLDNALERYFQDCCV